MPVLREFSCLLPVVWAGGKKSSALDNGTETVYNIFKISY